MRKKLFDIIEPRSGANKYADLYDFFMVCVILVCFIPMFFKEETPAFRTLDLICTIIFIIDYILRWMTADLKFCRKGVRPFLRYPFSAMAIVDLLSILPGLIALNPTLRLFRAVRLIRILRLLRIVRLYRYSKSAQLLVNVFIKQRHALLMVLLLTAGYTVISAIAIFNIEPDTFEDFFDALYLATISLTTIGYGDICPVTEIGKFITMVSSLIGVAVIAIPAGIITAGYVNEINGGKDGND